MLHSTAVPIAKRGVVGALASIWGVVHSRRSSAARRTSWYLCASQGGAGEASERTMRTLPGAQAESSGLRLRTCLSACCDDDAPSEPDG